MISVCDIMSRSWHVHARHMHNGFHFFNFNDHYMLGAVILSQTLIIIM